MYSIINIPEHGANGHRAIDQGLNSTLAASLIVKNTRVRWCLMQRLPPRTTVRIERRINIPGYEKLS